MYILTIFILLIAFYFISKWNYELIAHRANKLQEVLGKELKGNGYNNRKR